MNWIPREIIYSLNNLSCEDVAKKLDIKVEKHKALCFMHNDHHPSLTFFGKNREKWRCYVCNKGGGAIDLVMMHESWKFKEACQWLGEQFNINTGLNIAVTREKKPIIKIKSTLNNEAKPFSKDVVQWILDNCTLTTSGKRFLYEQRKLHPKIIEQLKIVSLEESKNLMIKLCRAFKVDILKESGLVAIKDEKIYFRMYTPCLLFPYYDKNGLLVGLQSRYLGDKKDAPRFQFVSAQKTRMFNMSILNSMNDGDDLYISEGITDCLALLSSGEKAVAIPSATILPQCDLIDLCKFKLHMYPDQDEAGQKAFANLRRYFINQYTLLIEEKLPKNYKDYSEFYIAHK